MKTKWSIKKYLLLVLMIVLMYCFSCIGAGAAETQNVPQTGTGITITDFVSDKNSTTGIKNTAAQEYKLEKPSFIKVYAKSNTSVKLTWKSVEHAQGYVIYRKTGSGRWKKLKELKNSIRTSFTDKKVKAGKTYRYRIRAFRKENGKKVYSSYSKIFKVKAKKPTVEGNYKRGTVYGPVSTKKQLAEVRRVAQGFVDNYIKAGMSEAQKAKAVFDYVRNSCDYTWEGWTRKKAGSAWGALVQGKAHCGGYSRAVKVLCDAVGIKCYYIHANEESFNPTHRWNLVRIDGTWYVLDTKDGAFLVGTDTFCRKLGMHWDEEKYPACSITDHEMSFLTTKEG